MKKNLLYSQASVKDCTQIAKFIRSENNNKLCTKKYINWWYFKKKNSGFNFTVLKSNNEIISISTINNAKFYLNNKIIEIGLPQNVVTKKKYRGRGLFSGTFKISEKKSIENKVNKFITFTNSASTPIFIKKFNYKRGICPNILFFPIFPFQKRTYKIKKIKKINNFLSDNNNQPLLRNSIIKDMSYLNWRYQKYMNNNTHILEYKRNDKVQSLIMIKFGYKKKIKICYLLDCIGKINKDLFIELKKYISNNNALFFLSLENENLKKLYSNFFFFKIKEKFNFLVKGKNKKETNVLSKTKFNITFGDLDFINLI